MDLLPASLRSSLINTLLWLSFISACLFYGVAENVMLLFFCAGFLLFACLFTPFSDWLRLYRSQRFGVWLCLYFLVVLTLAYQFVTISADSSFAMSWVLALPVIWYLVYAANSHRRWLRIALVATVCAFAVHSAVAYLAFGVRAYQPLGDPNHYASLLYLVWIPLAHLTLQRSWQGDAELRWLIPGHLLLFTVALAIAATGSRVGLVLIGAALLGWILLVALRRLSVAPLLGLLASTSAALLIWWLAIPEAMPSALDGKDFEAGIGIRTSLNMAAVDMMRAAPLFGHGVFTFPMLYPVYRLIGDQSSAGMYVHNDYLQLMAESGPWLVVVPLILLVLTARRLLLALFSKQRSIALDWFGLAMACAGLLAHASVNFVFYTLPLGIAFAVVCAELFSLRLTDPVSADGAPTELLTDADASTSAAAWPVRTGLVATLAGAFIFWAYLGLDVVVQGVFGGQLAPGPIGTLKRDVPGMVRFASTARSLNDKRVTPVLAEAALYAAMIEADPRSGISKDAILQRHRLAIAMDPYNSFVYRAMYDFIRRFGDRELISRLTVDESPQALLLKVVQLELGGTPSVYDLLSLYDQQGHQVEALSMLRTRVFPWLELIHWAQPANAEGLLVEMRQRADALGDVAFLAEIDRSADYLAQIRPDDRAEYLRDWQRELFR